MTRPYQKSPELEAKRHHLAMEMHKIHKDGASLTEIAKQYSVSTAGVALTFRRYGLQIFNYADRCNALRTATLDVRAKAKWGCTREQYVELRRMWKPTRAYAAQKRNANDRGIGWEFNLWQWWTVWRESGHWEHRGHGQGHVMCRHGDVGPYAVGNVFIAPSIVNCSDKAAKLSNLPIGVSAKHGRFLAKRMVDGRLYRLGVYETPEMAHAAYLSLGPIGCEKAA